MNSASNTISVQDDQLGEQLKAILLKALGSSAPRSSINESTSLNELGLESFNVVELLSAVEQEYSVSFDIEELSADVFESFGSLKRFVEAKLNARN